MGGTLPERVAVVSCHVERPLEDAVWDRFSSLLRSPPGGIAIAALLRPADTDAGEDEDAWAVRAREAASLAPFGHHTHWTGPTHARPSGGGTGARVRAEGRRLQELGLVPTLFCGGGWYADADVAEACAELGYVDCTPRSSRPPYLADGERWASLPEPACLRLPSGRTLRAVPTTHSIGDLGRALVRRALPPVVHVYFHDTDLLDRRRRSLVTVLLPLLARRARATDLDTLAREALAGAPTLDWTEVAREGTDASAPRAAGLTRGGGL